MKLLDITLPGFNVIMITIVVMVVIYFAISRIIGKKK